ncbi:tachykinins-like isoform X1 [Centruroides vittatus]|uniref:tachykinins-like isoform X1 n=1 Tax=Centruroides vittatus TaxID=120091 RepID=UPI003510161E
MTPIKLSTVHSWRISGSCCIVLFIFWTNAVTIIADNHQNEIGGASQIEGLKTDTVLTTKEKRSAEFLPESKEYGEELYNKDSTSFMPLRGKKSDVYQKDVIIDNAGVYGDDKGDLIIGNKPEDINMEDKRAFYAMRGKKDDFKRSFFAGTDNDKKDFNKHDTEEKRAFYAMRGKKDLNDEFDEDKRAFYAMRGKKDDLKRAFYAMRGKKGLDELEEDKRAFYAMRGKKDDFNKRAFYAMRGKKDDKDEDKRAFYAMRGKKDYYDENKRAFYAMRGKKDVDDFIDDMRHAYILHQDDELDDEIKRAALIPMRGKRNAHHLDLKETPVLKKRGKFFASRG